ncbi:DUF4129 domain-containing protein [Halorussus sp. MSC15.2]|uniref:DUF4129 domain-containing protein n=1 Tax=Halorussus sp. MSC15.2 TaxID=2283638 RepID=UPI0013D3CA70|nr:DUF4129 domain-containing protein [Halorussus sp. MSC15.2]NEU58200.1 DUF4129 domain-containing protein [Halorussus sp. MSC15.2]
MAHERRRAALAALCVFAVAVAATLLPASGFGSQPAGVGVGGGGADASLGGGGGPDADVQTTAESTPQPDTTTSDADSGDGGDTTTETTTTTATTTAASGGDTGGGGDLLGALVGVPLALVGVLGLVGFWTGALSLSRAAGPLPFTLVVGDTPLGELIGGIPTRTMTLVVGLSASVPRLLDDAAALSREVGRSFGTVLSAAGRGTADALRIGARGLAVTFTAVPRALAGLGAGAGVLTSLGNVSVPSFGGRSRSEDSGNSGGTPRDGPEDTSPPSVEEAWRTMRDRVAVRNRDARTPGEVARAAARRGYPDEAVRRLTEAFREVRYGDLPRDDRTDSARSALDRLRDYWRGEQ